MTKVIDATGLKCPLPVLKAQKFLRGMNAGETVVLTATDPNAPVDMEDLCRVTADELVASLQRADGVYEITIRKG